MDSTIKITLFSLLTATVAVAAAVPLNDPARLQPHYVKLEKVTYRGKAALRATDTAPENASDGVRLAVVPGSSFSDGTIEVELAGDVMPGSPAAIRGFTGIAFRVSEDTSAYECFYVRTLNGRSEDQLQRNHSVQYISPPDYPWQRLRKETPGLYETYVDLVPGEWTKLKITVKGDKARLFVNGAEQPTMIVNGLKHGVSKGSVALWIGPGVLAHFANLNVTPD